MIQIEHLEKRFGNVLAVNDLTLSIPKGELFCFLGPNGAGKTTTIKLLTGLLRPDRGTMVVGGFDLRTDPVHAKQIIGYIPDMPYLYDRLTPAEFMQFVGDLYGMPRHTVGPATDAAFGQFGLDPYRRALVGDLSHGLRQRLIYCATLLHDPRVMFIDEPFIGLDPYTIRMIKDLLRAKARAGMTVFLTTHILAVAEEIADRIGIIADGRLVALGRLQDISLQTGLSGHLEDVFLKLTQPEPAPAAG